MFDEGLGVPQNKEMAMILYNAAADQNHGEAQRALAHYKFMDEKKLRDEQFQRLVEMAQMFAEQAKAEQIRCRRPIGTTSYLQRKMQETGYRWEWRKPYGCP